MTPPRMPLRLFGFLLCCALLLPCTRLPVAVDAPVSEPAESSPLPEDSSAAQETSDAEPDTPSSEEELPGEFELAVPLPLELEEPSSAPDLPNIAVDEVEDDPDDISTQDEIPNYLALSETEVIVYSYGQLNTLLKSDTNSYTTFYFGANITSTGGTPIAKNKQHIVFDGTNPIDGPDRYYTYTDYGTGTFEETIYINETVGMERSITARNMIIYGNNYYSPFSIRNSVRECDLYLENIYYNGPQFIYSPRGHVTMTDCVVEIQGPIAQELAEVTSIEFRGDNRVDHQGATRVIFVELATEGLVRLDDGATLEVTVAQPDMCFFYGRPTRMEIGEGSALYYTAARRFTETAEGLRELHIARDGVVDITITDNNAADVLWLYGPLTVEEDGLFRIRTLQPNASRTLLTTYGAVNVEPGGIFHLIAEQGALHLLVSYRAPLRFEDPASVLLYNPTGRTIGYALEPQELTINAQQVNYWRAPLAWARTGGLDDPPDSSWRKADGSLFAISGTVANTVSGNFTAITSNYEEGDSPGYAPDAGNMNLVDGRLLSWGRLDLWVDPLSELSPAITGGTEPGAALRARYLAYGEEQTADGVAELDGAFSIELFELVPEEEQVVVRAAWNALFAEVALTSAAARIELEVPDSLRFGLQRLSGVPLLVPRADEGFAATVTDTRGAGSTWQLSVHLEEPFTPADAGLPALRDALVFVDEAGDVHTLSEHRHTPVASHKAESDREVTVIAWEPTRGLLARIPGGEGYAGQSYTAVVRWVLADVP